MGRTRKSLINKLDPSERMQRAIRLTKGIWQSIRAMADIEGLDTIGMFEKIVKHYAEEFYVSEKTSK